MKDAFIPNEVKLNWHLRTVKSLRETYVNGPAAGNVIMDVNDLGGIIGYIILLEEEIMRLTDVVNIRR